MAGIKRFMTQINQRMKKNNYRLSPSKLDGFRVYAQGIFRKTKEEYIKELTEGKPESEAMTFGKTVHSFIEKGDTGDLYPEEINYLLPFRQDWIDKAKEDWLEFELFEGCRILSRIDMIDGNVVEDIKVTGRYMGVDFYERSLQWKMYLMGLKAPMFRYHIFLRKRKNRPHKFEYKNFDFYAYTGMEDEIINWAERMIQFCEWNGIEDCIIDKNK